ncbi:MAG: ABC transporter ATP-binding protein [Gammaproteobacteria bacterium]|nr:ABC transporter ATP-binding protein [Gammaproteobacteria bacterium]MCP5195588.1 ABC transporter ATP-binding protein [Gammaproteobacteria bacterium]
MRNEILVQVERLTRCYSGVRVVDEMSFTLFRGQILGFLGANGAGKSTTLRMLAGVLAPDEGRIVIGGVDLLDQPAQAKRILGYLPEQPPLYHELTVDEQLHYSARLHGLSYRIGRQATMRIKQRCGLTEVGRRLIGHLSKGYRQRVGIAQAVLHDPSVIVLDEPTVGLDPIQSREIRELIRELGRERGVLLSSHLLTEVQTLCTHVQMIRAGRLVYTSALADLERQPSTRLRIALQAPPPLACLNQLPGVVQVDELGEGRFRLHHVAGVTPTALLIEQAGDWGLRELTPEYANLEQIFVELILKAEAD